MKLSHKTFVVIAVVAIAAVGVGWLYLRFDQESFMPFGKAGVALAAPSVYVFTEASNNRVEWNFGQNGRGRWDGKSRAESEVVIFDGSTVRPFAWASLFKRPLVIRFTRDQIRVYDFRRFDGIYYFRRERNGANQALQHNDPSCHVSCLRTPRASCGRG